MNQHLVLTAIGSDRPGICNQIIQLVTQTGCNIIDSRIAILGHEFTLLMWVSGKVSQISRIEASLPLFGQQHDIVTVAKRTSAKSNHDDLYHFDITVKSTDRVGLTENFTQFFADRHIGLSSLSAETISSPHQEDQFHITLSANSEAECDTKQIELDFELLCQSLAVQGTLNTIKNNSDTSLALRLKSHDSQ